MKLLLSTYKTSKLVNPSNIPLFAWCRRFHPKSLRQKIKTPNFKRTRQHVITGNPAVLVSISYFSINMVFGYRSAFRVKGIEVLLTMAVSRNINTHRARKLGSPLNPPAGRVRKKLEFSLLKKIELTIITAIQFNFIRQQ